MLFWLPLAGSVLTFLGAVGVTVTDAWFSRAVLMYLDVIEANVKKIAEEIRTGGSSPEISAINPKRDRGQDRARALKAFAWLTLTLGLGLQLAATVLASRATGVR